MELRSYDLVLRLKKARRRHHLSAATQALYHELVAICNEEQWADVFKCSNDEICSNLKITEKSLIEYRLRLIQAELIYYKSGKSKKTIGNYSFIKDINDCKIFSQSDSPNGSQSDSPKVEKGSDLNKHKPKTKQIPIADEENPPPGLWVKIKDGDEFKTFDHLKNLFSVDPGCQARWFDYRWGPENFEKGVELWMQRHHGKLYDDFGAARQHFYNWIPSYGSEQKKKTNESTRSNTKTGTAKKGSTISALQGLKRNTVTQADGNTSTGGNDSGNPGEEWQEAQVVN